MGPSTFVRSIPERLRSSYWFIPTLMLLAATVLAVITIQIDFYLFDRRGFVPPWLFQSGAEGGRAVLSTIASSMLGVAGVTFSVTMVALAMASNQFGARLLRTFMRDRGNQIVLGTFVATFLYCLLVLRSIRGEAVDGTAYFVPHVSITTSVVLAVCSLAVLIYFIHHVATTIQAPHVVAAVARELVDAIDVEYPFAHDGFALPDEGAIAWLDDDGEDLCARSTGYVRIIDKGGLAELAREHGLAIRMYCAAGDFIAEGEPYLRIGPVAKLDERLRDAASATLGTGTNRSIEQDAGFPLQQLVEMAIRALSPGINDPNTAAQCVDRIGVGLAILAGRPLPPTLVRYGDGLLLRKVPHLSEYLEGSFDRIRFHSRDSDPEMPVHLLEALLRIAKACRRPEDRDAVHDQARRVYEQLLADTRLTYARREVAELYQQVELALGLV